MTRALFNPKAGFAAFLIPAVLMLILQQTLMLSIGMTGGEPRERYAGRALPPRPEFENTLAVLLGKTLLYFPLYMLEALYMFYTVTDMFTLPMLGSVSDFILFMVPYLLACIFMAITFSAFIFRREDCIMLYVFMSLPLLFISGISWPGTAVPEFWRILGMIFPSTFALNGPHSFHGCKPQSGRTRIYRTLDSDRSIYDSRRYFLSPGFKNDIIRTPRNKR